MAVPASFSESLGRALMGRKGFLLKDIHRMGAEVKTLMARPEYQSAMAKKVSGAALTPAERAVVDSVDAWSAAQRGVFLGRAGKGAAMAGAVGVPAYAGYQMVKSSSESGLRKLGRGDWRYMLPNVSAYEAGKAQAMHRMNPEAMGRDAPWTVRHPILSGFVPGVAGTAAAGYLANRLTEGAGPTAQALATLLAGGGGYLLGQGLFNYLVNRPRIEASKARFQRVGADPDAVEANLREVARKNRLLRGVKGALSPTWGMYDKGYAEMLDAAASGAPDTAASKGLPVDVLEAAGASAPLPLVGALRAGLGGAAGWGSIDTARGTLARLGLKE